MLLNEKRIPEQPIWWHESIWVAIAHKLPVLSLARRSFGDDRVFVVDHCDKAEEMSVEPILTCLGLLKMETAFPGGVSWLRIMDWIGKVILAFLECSRRCCLDG